VNYPKFEIAFWHPFGPHGDEDTKEIIKRKYEKFQAEALEKEVDALEEEMVLE
jgi:hypothetical protein